LFSESLVGIRNKWDVERDAAEAMRALKSTPRMDNVEGVYVR